MGIIRGEQTDTQERTKAYLDVRQAAHGDQPTLGLNRTHHILVVLWVHYIRRYRQRVHVPYGNHAIIRAVVAVLVLVAADRHHVQANAVALHVDIGARLRVCGHGAAAHYARSGDLLHFHHGDEGQHGGAFVGNSEKSVGLRGAPRERHDTRALRHALRLLWLKAARVNDLQNIDVLLGVLAHTHNPARCN